MFGISQNVWVVVALAAAALPLLTYDLVPWGKLAGLLKLPTIKAKKTSDEADLAALKQLCPRYKGDPESEKAIHVLKERFLLVPGAAQ